MPAPERGSASALVWVTVAVVGITLVGCLTASFLMVALAGRRADRDDRVAQCLDGSRGSVAHAWFARQAQYARSRSPKIDDQRTAIKYGTVAEFWENYAGVGVVRHDASLRTTWADTRSVRLAKCEREIPEPRLFG